VHGASSVLIKNVLKLFLNIQPIKQLEFPLIFNVSVPSDLPINSHCLNNIESELIFNWHRLNLQSKNEQPVQQIESVLSSNIIFSNVQFLNTLPLKTF
jgi:hypothetical protein